MKRLVLTLALVPLVLSGCRSAGPRAQDGALLGSLVGAGAGYAVGKHNGHRGKGAAIGAVIGGLLGYAIGDDADDRRYGTRPYHDPAADRPRSRGYDADEVVIVEDAPVRRRRVIVHRRPVIVEEEVHVHCHDW